MKTGDSEHPIVNEAACNPEMPQATANHQQQNLDMQIVAMKAQH